MKKISVLIPTFNDEDTLELCLRSFAGLADEMCLVDDCSEDATPDIIRRLSNELPFPLNWERNPQRVGWVENRQRLLQMAQHEIVFNTDSDCVLREECIDNLRWTADQLSPKWGFYLPTITLAGDVFHTNHEVVHQTFDPNHSLWRRLPAQAGGGQERWFTNKVHSEEYLADVAFPKAPYPEPVLFHLKSVRSDWRNIQRHYARQWLASGTDLPFVVWLMREESIGEGDWAEWVRREGLKLILSEGIQRYDPEEWYPYPKVMMGAEMENPRYRLLYGEGDQIIGRIRRS